MEVENIVEHKDGGATFTFHMTKEEHDLLLSGAIFSALLAGIEAEKRRNEGFE